MRRSRSAKAASRDRIITHAARIMRQRGAERTSVTEVMDAAGLTAGGFYRHFDSRDALLAAALPATFEHFGIRMMQHLAQAEPGTPFENFERFYLSHLHIDDLGSGCPLAALGGDMARASEPLKSTFGEGLRRVIAVLAMGVSSREPNPNDTAARQLATLVGAVILARASDPDTGRFIITACHGAASDEPARPTSNV
jgi:TetR/AcrR family transcriptional repressor of nem operon